MKPIWPHGYPHLIEAGDFTPARVKTDATKMRALNKNGVNWFLAFFREPPASADAFDALTRARKRKGSLKGKHMDIDEQVRDSFVIKLPNRPDVTFGYALIRINYPMKPWRTIGMATAAILFVGSSSQAFQVVKPSCSLLYSPEQNIIYDRDKNVPERKVIDMDHDLLKHPEKLRIFANPNAYVTTVENMIRETYRHPDFDITDMMMRFSAEGYCI